MVMVWGAAAAALAATLLWDDVSKMPAATEHRGDTVCGVRMTVGVAVDIIFDSTSNMVVVAKNSRDWAHAGDLRE